VDKENQPKYDVVRQSIPGAETAKTRLPAAESLTAWWYHKRRLELADRSVRRPRIDTDERTEVTVVHHRATLCTSEQQVFFAWTRNKWRLMSASVIWLQNLRLCRYSSRRIQDRLHGIGASGKQPGRPAHHSHSPVWNVSLPVLPPPSEAWPTGLSDGSNVITSRVRRSRDEMYSGHGRLCVCVNGVPVCPSLPRRIPTLLH